MKRILLATVLGLSFGTSAMACELQISNAWVKPTFEGRDVTAAYFDATNTGTKDCTILGIGMEGGMPELHEIDKANGTFQMRRLDEVVVPAGKTVQFKQGGLHVMLTLLSAPIKEGDTLSLTAYFSDRTNQRFPVLAQKR